MLISLAGYFKVLTTLVWVVIRVQRRPGILGPDESRMACPVVVLVRSDDASASCGTLVR